MPFSFHSRAVVMGVAAMAFAAAHPSVAGAVSSGKDGRIALVTSDNIDSMTQTVITTRLVTVKTDGNGARLLHTCVDAPGEPCLLVNPQASVAWSPDGKRLAVSVTASGGGEVWDRIAVVNANGTGWHVLTPSSPSDQRSPVWSPDGKRIAFLGASGGGPTSIYTMTADGAHPRRFAGSRGAGSLSWSSRNAIAYATVQGIFRVDSRGHHTKTLVSSGAVGGPEWTPSGDRLLFGQLSGRRGTWSIDSNGKGRRFENREFGLLSPSGKRLLSAGDDGEFVISSLDGAAPRRSIRTSRLPRVRGDPKRGRRLRGKAR